jgi:hypothetical protein
MAEREAQRERADAQLHAERASAHERGMADDELMRDEERDRGGAGTAAGNGADAGMAGDRGRTGDATEVAGDRDRTSAYEEGRRAEREPGAAREEDFREGRMDERRRDERGGVFGRFRRRKEREPARRT